MTKTWASGDFGVCGGSLNKSPHIARDNYRSTRKSQRPSQVTARVPCPGLQVGHWVPLYLQQASGPTPATTLLHDGSFDKS